MRQPKLPVIRFFQSAALIVGTLTLLGCAGGQKPAAVEVTAPAPKPVEPEASSARLVDPNGRVVIALLAPTSAEGKRARAAAQDMVTAAQMAREAGSPGNVQLKVYDTKGEPDSAAAAAQAAMRDGAALIIGPLFAATTEAVGPVAAEFGVNVLSFSSDAKVAGENVWVLGKLPQQELARVMSYAGSQGVVRAYLAHPENRYGQFIADEFDAAATNAGLSTGNVTSYPRTFKGIEAAAKPVAEQIVAETEAMEPGQSAVLVADTGDALRSMTSFLNYYDVAPRHVKYIGLSRWMDPKNLKEATLIGGWFAAPDPDLKTDFAERFAAENERRPTPLASISYEAMGAVNAMLVDAQSTGSAPFQADAITTAAGFAGVDGPFYLTSDGLNNRALAILTVARDGFRVVDPAPVGAPNS
ncbi:MAG: penicillin-binding protein activator [Pikeienuella sp.]